MVTRQASGTGTFPDLVGPGAGKLYINGQWVPPFSGRTFPTINPTTGSIIGEIAEGGPQDADLAVQAARKALDGPWGCVSPSYRQRVLWQLADLIEQNYDELHHLEVLDMGMPVSATKGAAASVEVLRYFAGWATKLEGATVPNSLAEPVLSYTVREPIGVVAAIIPWNSPLRNALLKIAPALTTGCAMVLKPAEQASLTALRLGELISELDLPAGVVNIVTGSGDPVGTALTTHPDVDKVSFTGSTATGQAIVHAAAGNLKRLSLELGGKSPNVVFADADLDRAVPAAAMGVFRNSGQMCIAGSRIFVERPVYGEFVARLAAFAQTLKVGDSLSPKTQIGPLVSQEQLDRVIGYLADGRREGAHLATGGSRLTHHGLESGYFIPPTVFSDVTDEMRICQDEIFGPVACVLPFDAIDEVITRANDTRFGLASGVWTRDITKAHGFAQAIKAGSVWVNTYQAADAAVSFGGYKMSGWGRECGRESLDGYLAVKSVWIRTD
jgi:aldehyde dehydrogenase (NAD+)